MSIGLQERNALLSFIERNVSLAPRNMDEGMGTVYERVIIDSYFRQLQARHGIHTVLESPADGVSGVPGINSLEFARNGGVVWLANPSQLMLDSARPVWEKQGLVDCARFVRCEVDDTPFGDDSFDFVWNYCMFERFRDPEALIREMKRVSQRFVFIMTQNAHTWGTGLHKAYHAAVAQEWDHGHEIQMAYPAIRNAVRQQGLQIVEEGALDVPPWLDTWDLPLRAPLKQLLSLVGRKWEWKLEEQGQPGVGSNSRVVAITHYLETNLPEWFRRSQAHHLYVLAQK